MREPYLLFRNRLIWTVGSDGVLDGLEDPSYSFVTGWYRPLDLKLRSWWLYGLDSRDGRYLGIFAYVFFFCFIKS
jgi:hypothetical protein